MYEMCQICILNIQKSALLLFIKEYDHGQNGASLGVLWWEADLFVVLCRHVLQVIDHQF